MFNPAHVHPLIVQFPLILLPASALIQFLAFLNKEDLRSNFGYAGTGFRILVLGTVLAYLSIGFGDIALDKALALGFQPKPLHLHQNLSYVSFLLFALSSLFQCVYRWKRKPFNFKARWLVIGMNLIATLILISSVYTGLMLVLEQGVNVDLN